MQNRARRHHFLGSHPVWIEFAVKCCYLDREAAALLYQTYDETLRMLVAMINSPESWIISPP